MGGGRFQREERTVVADLSLPVSVEVVGHDVEKVDVLDDFGDVVTCRNCLRAGRHGGRQQETRQLVGDGFTLESQSQLFNETEEGRPVVRTPAPATNQKIKSLSSIL